MLPTPAVLSTKHYAILPSATAAAVNNQAAYSGRPIPMRTNNVRDNYTSKYKPAKLNPLTHLRHAPCADEGDDVLPVAAKPANRCTQYVDTCQATTLRAKIRQPSPHLSMASKNFSCSSSLHLSRGLVIL